MSFGNLGNEMKLLGSTCRRYVTATLTLIALSVVSSAAQTTDVAVQSAVDSGASARVILQFPTTDARDGAFNRLLDRGAAVRATDTEAGPALVVLGSGSAVAPELTTASHASIDAVVASTSTLPARARSVRSVSTSRQIVPLLSGPSVAIIDSGIYPHADLVGRIRKFKDFVSGGSTPVDGCGHGTHVAGIVAGDGKLSAGEYAGIAPHMNIVALRVLADDCSGQTSDVIDALEWVGKNHETYKIKVVNLSLGHPVFESITTDPLVQAVERLARKGILVVTAAGNMGINPKTGLPGYGGVGVPCNAPSSLCVGSLDTHETDLLSDDTVASTSSRGPSRYDLLAKPDLVAPGVRIISLGSPNSMLFNARPENQVVGRVQGVGSTPGYLILSGTSMAAPMAAGAAALVFEANPGLAANTVKMVLQFTARQLPNIDMLTQGAGALNVNGALIMASAINPNATAGRSWLRYNVPTSNYDANLKPIRWGKRIIYGDRLVPDRYAGLHLMRWDDNIVWGYDAIDDNIVWGHDDDNIVWGHDDNIVWGHDDNIIWGNNADDNIVWGHNIVWGVNDVVQGYWASNLTFGFWDDNIVWGHVTRNDLDNIVWGHDDDNIVWGHCSASNDDDNIVWGHDDDNIVWGHCDDNIVWGHDDDNIVWGHAVLTSPDGGR
jgi:subtilisin family serine protease